MSDPAKNRLTAAASRSNRGSPSKLAADARRALSRMERPSGTFDATRYFRGDVDLGFYNVGMLAVRTLARSIYATHRQDWSVDDAVDFAEILIRDRHLEAKLAGIEFVARYRREFTPRLLMVWKRWLARGYSANWATTDAICGMLIGPLLAAHPDLAEQMRAWARARSLWVRRAAAVSLTALARKGKSLDLAYDIALALHPDREDLIHKGVGWLLREAGKTDARRLERYLRQHGPAIPRTTLRYAIERMPLAKRQEMLRVTKTRK